MKSYRYTDSNVCAKCGRNKEDLKFIYCAHCRAEHNEVSREYYEREKEQLLFHYSKGTNACSCCGETLKTMLTLDHINNDGYKERGKNRYDREAGAIYGRNYYRKLIREGFPEGLQVLCANCNTSKMRNKGQCEHKGIVNRKELIPKIENKKTGPKIGVQYFMECQFKLETGQICGKSRVNSRARCKEHEWTKPVKIIVEKDASSIKEENNEQSPDVCLPLNS